ncbi:helix-turn-helix domain-containing protein [Rhodococcus sp. 14C212]|nr:helix-turn-helix domain-containing protein [Rhodococcus sp. 14C212]
MCHFPNPHRFHQHKRRIRPENRPTWCNSGQTPDRVSPRVLGALCAIFACELEDLLTFTYAEQTPRRAATGTSVIDLNTVGRPRRARIIRDDTD